MTIELTKTEETELNRRLYRVKQAAIAMRIIDCLVDISERGKCRNCKDYAKCVKTRDIYFE